MKRFLRTFSLVLALTLALSAVGFSAFAAEFTDYYETPYYYFGDTDFDGKITVRDATALQKHIAKIITLSEDALYYGDVNGSGDVTVSDATTIQKYVANIIDIFPVEESLCYEYTADGTALEVEIPANGSAEIEVAVSEGGFYDFSATAEGESIFFDVTSEDMEDYWVATSDGETSTVFAELTEGVYYVYISSMSETDTVVQFKAGISESEPPFAIEDAVELKVGDKVEVKAGFEQLIYKVNSDELSANGIDMHYLYTEGDDPRVSMACYDEKYGVCGESMPYDDTTNVILSVYRSYSEADPWAYIVVTQAEGGSDFTLYCASTTTMIKEAAVDVELGNTATLDEYAEEYEDEEMAYYLVEAIFKFTPEESGYYSFNYESATELGVVGSIVCFDNADALFPVMGYSEEGVYKDIRYLEAGAEYYVMTVVSLSEDVGVGFTLNEATKEEYDALYEDGLSDATPDEIEYTEISVGDSVELSFEAEEFVTSDFSFTATEDCTVVLYSEGSVDAYVEVFDAVDLFYFSDDIYAADSTDFAVIGTLTAGETVYFCVGTNSETGDSFTLHLVNEADYTPIA